ncbi:MAG TPA: peptidylprolyl isomerase [Candidatus Dormibacteraeota bacterium]|nr:peptidylprolyl isomerase [Candidatus Dormibacteraeota bacterium]
MSSRRQGRRVPPRQYTTSATNPPTSPSESGTGAEMVKSVDRPIGTRSANRAAKRAATGVRPKVTARGGRSGGRKQGSNTGIIVLAVAAIAVAAAVILLGKPFGAPAASPSPGASVASQVGDGTCPAAQPDPLPAGQIRSVTINTPKGAILINVEADLSPIAAGNFVALVQCHFYDGSVFHRTASQDGTATGTPFVIQGGAARPGTAEIPYTIKDEPVTAQYRRGTVAMARSSAPNSQTSQFFIVLADSAGSILSATNTYAIFGEVVSGMDVADAIYKASNGVELPTNPVPMTSVTVSSAPLATASPGPTSAPTVPPSTTPAATQ